MDVALFDRNNYHLFQPLLYQVASAVLSPAEIAEPIRRILSRQRNCRVYLNTVEAIDPNASMITIKDANNRPYLVKVTLTTAIVDLDGNNATLADMPLGSRVVLEGFNHPDGYILEKFLTLGKQ